MYICIKRVWGISGTVLRNAKLDVCPFHNCKSSHIEGSLGFRVVKDLKVAHAKLRPNPKREFPNPKP